MHLSVVKRFYSSLLIRRYTLLYTMLPCKFLDFIITMFKIVYICNQMPHLLVAAAIRARQLRSPHKHGSRSRPTYVKKKTIMNRLDAARQWIGN